MATAVPARLTPREGRSFGFTVGIAFVVLAGFLYWRGAVRLPPVLAVLGAVLLGAGLVLPTRLGPVQRAWMGLAHALSRITTPILMAVIFFVTILPIGLIMRALGRNPLARPSREDGYWVRRVEGERQSDLRRQF